MPVKFNSEDQRYMSEAIALAGNGRGFTSPNPCVGAVLVKARKVIGSGWHRRAGGPHAEIAAFRDAARQGNDLRGATLYVTLEPCSTTGKTPPCTEAILAAKLNRVVVAAKDPNPNHAGRGLSLLRRAGVKVESGLLAEESARLNEAFNHWIVHHTPFVTVKSAMTLDGKIATASGDSKWITGDAARCHAMNQLRRPADAILVGINTILADNPSLTYRGPGHARKHWLRIVLDTNARTPLTSNVVRGADAKNTLIVVGEAASVNAVAALSEKVTVWQMAIRANRIDLKQLVRKLGAEGVTSLLVEGGGEVNGQFLQQKLAHRIAFYFAPKILGGRSSIPGVAGDDPRRMLNALDVRDLSCERAGDDWFFTGLV
jgi:diaminohydroxyphosphoribosylaminopyrimidine deaminase/5-amino-6-(5-phosphoribosylamino)uracil reductase